MRHGLGYLVAAFGLLIGTAQAAPRATLNVSFKPYRLGSATNVAFAIGVSGEPHRLPPPLTYLKVLFPTQLGVAVSGLGLTACSRTTLEAIGPGACPENSHMGEGNAIAKVPFGPEVVEETATVTILRATAIENHPAMYFYVEAPVPILAGLLLTGDLEGGPGPFETLQVQVPTVTSLPGGPAVSVVALRANIGPRGLLYSERHKGQLVHYRPRGVILPERCPHRGFRFKVSVGFADKTTATAEARVKCQP